MKKILVTIVLIFVFGRSYSQLTLTFPASDGLQVTADWYPVSSDLPVILLCHQNGSSRGEYTETALRLNKFGFNCLAVDQRAGMESNGIRNETAKAALLKRMTPTLADAEKDIVAAVEYLYKKYERPIIVLGSSYSGSLVLKIAVDNPKIASVIVFSPGEYFEEKNYIGKHLEKLTKPVFATSSQEEADVLTDFLKDVNSRIKIQYIPSSKGDHGSKVLWSESPYNQEYWIALMSFLNRIKTSE